MSFSRREEEREAEVAAAGGASSLGKVGIGGTLFFAHHIVKCVFSFRLIFLPKQEACVDSNDDPSFPLFKKRRRSFSHSVSSILHRRRRQSPFPLDHHHVLWRGVVAYTVLLLYCPSVRPSTTVAAASVSKLQIDTKTSHPPPPPVSFIAASPPPCMVGSNSHSCLPAYT